MNKTIIVDYNAGNLRSVANMLTFLNVPFSISSNKDEILNAKRIIFPGQGHFRQAMNNLEQKGLSSAIKECCENGIPFLGICIGLQILFEKSEEAPDVKGLGIINGEVKKFREGKTPQIGWNKVVPVNNEIIPEEYFYFVNSYYVVPEDKSFVSSICDYNGEFCSSIQKGNITAVQFHPEKSANAGLTFFRNWLKRE